MDHNPYDLIPTRINGQEFQSRPIAFDGDNPETMVPTRVSTICPTCGQGLEYDVYLSSPPYSLEFICYICNPDPPPAADPFMNPLEEGRVGEHELDPLLHDPNKQIVTNDDDDESSVADRLNLDDEDDEDGGKDEDKLPTENSGAPAEVVKDPIEPDFKLPKIYGMEGSGGSEEGSDDEAAPKPDEVVETQEKPKKTAKKATKKKAAKKSTKKKAPKKKVPVEPADGLTEEVDIDDDDLVENE